MTSFVPTKWRVLGRQSDEFRVGSRRGRPPYPPPLLARNAQRQVEEALDESRVVALLGARQVGKTTLARRVAEARGGTYLSLDVESSLASARRDPATFLEASPPLVIDEFQRAGDALLRAVKIRVDADPTPGRFLLTGSTRYLTIPTLSESLAGRVEIVDLWPLSQGEMRGVRDRFVDRLFGSTDTLRRAPAEGLDRAAYLRLVAAGGFPALRSAAAAARRRWHGSYVRTVTQRDVEDFSRAQRLDELPRLLRLLSARTAQELNVSAVASDVVMPRSTLAGYLALLENVYLVYRVPAWSRNATTKVIRHPKLYLTDTGLACSLLGTGPEALAQLDCRSTGPLVETFVAGEIARQATWCETALALGHFRDRDGAEVDLVLEAHDGRVAGVEVKAATTVHEGDFRGLDLLRRKLGERFVNGVVLHLGKEQLPFGDRRTALPLSALWAA